MPLHSTPCSLILLFISSVAAQSHPNLLPVTPKCPTVTLVYQPTFSQINASVDPTNKYGLEDGIVVRRADGGFSMISAEMYGDPRWVAMRLGVWKSRDGLEWRKVRNIRQSSSNFDGTDIHSSSWGPFFVYDPRRATWALSYVGYRGAPSNSSGWLENFDGTIFAQYASAKGDEGLDSDFGDVDYRKSDRILLQPDDFNVRGPWPYVCQGLQGTDSFYPYQLANGSWAALVGTSHQETPDPWPGGKWPVSLALAPDIMGPWKRYNPSGPSAAAPCVNLNDGYSENPIVSRRPDNPNAFHLVIDWIMQEDKGFGYSCSNDGIRWSEASMVRTPAGCRTPFGLVPLTDKEIETFSSKIIRYGVINASQIRAANTSLQWAFYTRNTDTWEVFHSSIVQLVWT